jgi:hypothetical protein
MNDIQPLIDFLVALGIRDLPHTGHTYLAHLVAVRRDLVCWGCSSEVANAGMFHSIYGTERFQGFKLPLEQRPEVRQLIGPRAEFLAWCNCFLDRASFDANLNRPEPYWFVHRETGERIDLGPQEFDDLCRIHLCDWLEQVPRAQKWDYRRAAYRQMAEHLGGPALAAYDRVFALERHLVV